MVIGHDIDIFSNGDDIYSSIDSRRQMLDTQQVNYKIAGKGKGGKPSGTFKNITFHLLKSVTAIYTCRKHFIR